MNTASNYLYDFTKKVQRVEVLLPQAKKAYAECGQHYLMIPPFTNRAYGLVFESANGFDVIDAFLWDMSGRPVDTTKPSPKLSNLLYDDNIRAFLHFAIISANWLADVITICTTAKLARDTAIHISNLPPYRLLPQGGLSYQQALEHFKELAT